MKRFSIHSRVYCLCLALAASGCGGSTDSELASPRPPRAAGGGGAGPGGPLNVAGSAGSVSPGNPSQPQPVGFSGTPGGFAPLKAGCGPSTSQQCGGSCESTRSNDDPSVIRPPAALCFVSSSDPTPNDPMALIEQVIEEIDGRRMVHLRITFDPSFVDNTYGQNAVGWDRGVSMAGATGMAGGAPLPDGKAGMDKKPKPGKSGHTFGDLVGSDHVELLLTNGSGETVMNFKLDYITGASTTACGYTSLGVSGGEGKFITGTASAVLGATSSLDRNLNGCGYCLTEDSPATDPSYTPNPLAPSWDFRVVYEVWLSLEAFGSSGFGQAYIESVHASPSKLDSNTALVEPGPCPPSWDSPYCPPGAPAGVQCEDQGTCPPNQQLYIQTEGRSVCTPIPFANYPNMAACPTGYRLDLESEGRFCLPTGG